VALRIRTRAVLKDSDVIEGAAVLLEEAFIYREELSGPPMYGCLDATTGIPLRRLTRAVLNECMAGVEESHLGFGVLRIRVLGLEEFRAKHGPQSVVPFLRTTAHTLRHSLIEGHTDAKPFAGKSSYSNWELSADRANAARRLMQQSGLRPDQVSQVRGFADQRMRNAKEPLDPSNRRISIIVQTLAKDAAGNDTGEGKSSGADAQESSVAKPPAAGAKAGSEPTVEKDGK
jgi:hypothetical protein